MHIAEKYMSLARDAMSSGDSVAAENYLQHAEHYNRIIMAAQAQNPPMGMDGQQGLNGSSRFHGHEPLYRDFDGEGEDGDTDDFEPPRRQYQERQPYNQHHQPQPQIPQNAFSHTQPQSAQAQPQAQAQSNGVNGQAHSADRNGVAPDGEPAPNGERLQRRRRRRPNGEGQMREFPLRNGSSHPAQGNGASEPNDGTPDEASS